MKNKNSEIVYSTDPGFLEGRKDPEEEKTAVSKTQPLKLFLDRKQRAGKSVSVIEGFIGWSDDKIEDLAKILKTQCATGGTVKDRKIEIQGDQRSKIEMILNKMRYKTKRTN